MKNLFGKSVLHRLMWILCAVVLAACSIAPLPIVTSTAESLNSPTTPTLMKTPTSTVTATSTPTFTATPTPTLKPTSTATKMHMKMPTIGRKIFSDDFGTGKIIIDRSGNPKWNNIHSDGGTVTIEDAEGVLPKAEIIDGQGNPRGKVMVARLGDAVKSNYGSGLWQILYPDFFNYDSNGNIKYVKGPAGGGVSVDFWKNNKIIGGGNILSAHRMNIRTGNIDSVVAINLGRDDQLRLTIRDTNGHDIDYLLDNRLFDPKTMNNIMIIIDNTGRVFPFINGRMALFDNHVTPTVPFNPDYPGSFTDAHAGFLHGSVTGKDNDLGAIVVNDNFSVFEVKDFPENQ